MRITTKDCAAIKDNCTVIKNTCPLCISNIIDVLNKERLSVGGYKLLQSAIGGLLIVAECVTGLHDSTALKEEICRTAGEVYDSALSDVKDYRSIEDQLREFFF